MWLRRNLRIKHSHIGKTLAVAFNLIIMGLKNFSTLFGERFNDKNDFVSVDCNTVLILTNIFCDCVRIPL
jgi:hypothetical protein